PDNRRAVDFGLRADALEQIEHLERDRGRRALVKDLAVSWRDGRVKLHVLRSLLPLRRDHEGLFADGSYVPLEVTGRRRGNVVAFARRSGPTLGGTVAPRPPD